MARNIITVNSHNIDEAISATVTLYEELKALKNCGHEGSIDNYVVTDDDLVAHAN